MRAIARPLGGLLVAASVAALPAPAASPADALRQAEQLQQMVTAVQARYRSLPAFEVTFEQRLDSVTFGSEERATGTVLVRRPDRMLWSYAPPDGRQGIYDGVLWWLLDPTEKHATRREAGPDDLVAGLLMGQVDILTLFAVEASAERASEPGVQRLELLPRTPRDDVEVVHVDIDPGSHELRRVAIQDPVGNRFVCAFGAARPVPRPADTVFRVAIPDGWTVAHE